MAIQRWGGLRQQPYDVNAVDADNDGIVQEGTLFERPAGTRFVNQAGEAVRQSFDGSTLSEVQGMRLVDRRGRPVQYQPSWYGQSLPLSQRLPSVGSRMSTIGASLGTLDGPPK